MGLTPWRRPIDLRKVLSGTILLSEPMDSVYKQTDENKRKKSVYDWILTKMFWICTMKFRYVHKRILWDLHREGGPWSIEKFERRRNQFYRLNRIDHGKKMQVWWNVLKKWFENVLKYEVHLWEVLKKIGSRKLEKFTLKGGLKSVQNVVFGSIRI